ncbi:MAG TPA: FHIPEP family type III secretion protein, partial [Chitinophagaceae bacterium]
NKGNILHPANDSECIVVAGAAVAAREFQVWPPFAFMGLHLVDFYRKNTNWFLDSGMCKNIIDDLNNNQPALIARVHSKVDDHFICRVLRLLIEEKISLRNIESIFQSIIDFDYVVADGINNIVFDSRLTTLKEPGDEWLHDPGNTADFVRLNLKQYISSMLTNNSYSLYVYLLDRQMEEKILKMDKIVYTDPAFYDLLNSVEKVIGENRNNLYPLLSTVEVRRKLKQIVKNKFPELAVICYQELSSSTNITPVAKIFFNNVALPSLDAPAIKEHQSSSSLQ